MKAVEMMDQVISVLLIWMISFGTIIWLRLLLMLAFLSLRFALTISNELCTISLIRVDIKPFQITPL